MAYGRPMKGKFRRVPAMVHIPTEVLDIIDTHLEEINERDGTKITWSDFIVEAIEARIKELGLDDGGESTNGVTQSGVRKIIEEKIRSKRCLPALPGARVGIFI